MPLATGGPSNFTTKLTATADVWVKRNVTDQIFDETVLLDQLKRHGCIVRKLGGEGLRYPLRYKTNSTFGYFSGMEAVDTSVQDRITAAVYTWSTCSVQVTLPDDEMAQNKGEAQIINRLQEELTSAKDTIRDNLNEDLYSGNATETKQTLGLSQIVAASGSIGGIDGGTYSWWVSQSGTATDFNGTWGAANTAQRVMAKLYNDCAMAAGPRGAPNIILIDQTGFEAIEYALATKGYEMYAYRTDKNTAGLSFTGIRFKDAVMFPDTDCTSTYGYFLDTRRIRLVINPAMDFDVVPFQHGIVNGQHGTISSIRLMLSLQTDNRSKLGLLAGTGT